MAPTTTQEEGGEASAGSRSRSRSSVDEEDAARRTKKRNVGDQEEPAASSSAGGTEESSSSSAVSSPIRRPYIPRVVKGYDEYGEEILEPFCKIDERIVDAHLELNKKYFAKAQRQQKLVTLESYVPRSFLGNPKFGHIRDSATKTVLRTAKVVLGLSSYIDGNNLLKRCSGFLIDWNRDSKVGTVLTSAILIRSSRQSIDDWSRKDVYVADAKCGLGGPVIDLNGQVLGMVSLSEMSFIPSSILLKCLGMLEKFDCIPRLHTGMKFSAIRFLDPIHIEKIIRKCKIDDGLIVTEVSEGSAAEKLGIRNGDVVECWNGEYVSTTIELENLLLRISEEYLDHGDAIGSNVDVPVGLLRVRKGSHCTVTLTVKICDDVEMVAEGKYAVTEAHCAMLSDDDEGLGQEAPCGTRGD